MKYFYVIVGSLVLLSGPSFAKSATYRVALQEGEFFVWSGLDVGWEPVKTKAVYPENAIFQSLGSSRIDLRQTKETVQGSAKNIFLETKGRIIFRINDEVVRKLSISNNFVSKLDTGIKEEEKEEKLDITSAWKKIASLMKPTSQSKGGDNAKVGTDAASKPSGVESDPTERIEFTYPARGGIFVPEVLPMDVPIIWKNASNEKGCYEVFVKAVDRTGFDSVGVVREPRMDVKISKPGAYVIRVQCAGNNARSEELTFNVLPANAKEWQRPVSSPKKSPISKKKDAEQ